MLAIKETELLRRVGSVSGSVIFRYYQSFDAELMSVIKAVQLASVARDVTE